MREIETDYLVVGAGASGMGFVDEMIAHSDTDIVMVDRRHRPGGHWLDAYPFVRIHQTSANYGVNSRVLGSNRIDDSGPNEGFYERATADEICDYYNRVLEEHFLPSGQVRFFGMSDYKSEDSDGHHYVSTLTGERTTVKVRRKLVDGTYTESSIPSKHTPSFEVDDDVVFVPPNDLVNMSEPVGGFTVLGAGKTAMDTCNWLLDVGVAPDRIRWVRPRDSWTMDRACMQPLELVSEYMEFLARFAEVAATAEDGADFARQLEDRGVFVRIDPSVEPGFFRGAILSAREVESLRRIENVVRQGKVLRIGTDRVTLTEGSIPGNSGEVYVDCTAAGARPTVPRPVFESGRIVMQLVTLGILPWSAATIGSIEASRENDDDKNGLCPSFSVTGQIEDLLRIAYEATRGNMARMAEPDIAEWNEACRLNPMRGAMDRLDDPRIAAALATFASNLEPALANVQRLLGASAATPV